MKKTLITKRIADMLSSAERSIIDATERKDKATANSDKLAAMLAFVPDSVQWVSVYAASVDYTWQVKGFNSAKTKKLLEQYIDLADTFGMRLETSSEDSPEYNTRTFRFKYFAHDSVSRWCADLSVSVRCELIEGGTACRRVVVGEKVETVRTPEYKFVCK